ncbi:glutamyl-tRNA synthetase [Polymorphobacter multimanifer]|uniref:Glutamate--tRNA ligase n=2 Tax=Polymorphobacter multimanifer TaxID=1070431 RepID=A0A841LIP8_9SPHN|nr:glutamate--tRNA ligase [Polymorphobacter multimanifer]MBB6228838.1 glutamyl-tRNA synthetase [Polymorphobacter multimanifer]
MSASAPSSAVVTRFAPSPTGFLHIGGARTALFNYLFARHHGGSFRLRIEDTDRARSTDAAIAAILDGMGWLGLDHDDEIVYQFSRAARHAEVAHALLEAGHAYRCYATAEELEAMRAQQRAEKRPLRYDGRWRDRSDGPEGAPFVIRLKAPQTGEVTIDDKVQGPVTVANAELDDMVLLRSDGTPTYMLAVVVDDHDMGVTHVIRGDDHLNNAFRQLALIRAMNEVEGEWPEPIYAHIPLIHGADGAKLSKRHGALGVDAYRDQLGLLPEALENYLLRLGWGHGDDEVISRAQAIEWFSLEAVGRSPSRFDMKKLESVNGHYIRATGDARLTTLIQPKVESALARPLAPQDIELLQRSMAELKKRAPDLNSLAASALFYLRTRPIPMDEAALRLLASAPSGLLVRARAALAAVSPWVVPDLEAAARELATAEQLKLGAVAQPLRAALTGAGQSPGLFEVMEALGRDETLGRIDDAIAQTHETTSA